MGTVLVIKPDREGFEARVLAAGLPAELAGALREGKVVRVEVDLASRTCQVLFEAPAAWGPAECAAVEERLSGLLPPGFQVRFSVQVSVRSFLQTVEDPVEVARIREGQERDEAERIASLLREGLSAGATSGDGDIGGGEPETPLLGRPFHGEPVRLGAINDEQRSAVVEGEVIAAEVRELKGGRRLLQFDLTDYSDSLSAKCFLDKGDSRVAGEVVPGVWLRVRGAVQLDRFNQELTLMAEDICRGRRPVRRDLAAEKRVELHLHTKFSAMDGCVEIAEAVQRAAEWGHQALAVTDHGVVQSFPQAYELARKAGVKLILGLEAYLVDDGMPIVTRPTEASLEEAEVVALDIETTGLSPFYDEIVEVGAVRLQGGKVVEEWTSFIRPTREIPPKVQELTGITPEMVAGAEPAQAVLERFWAWVGDRPLVAHNASFDLAFLRIWTERLLGRPVVQPVVDTLWLARAVLPRLKSHNLATVGAHLKVPLDQHHRALSDARTAGLVFYGLLQRARRGAEEGGATRPATSSLRTLADLNQLSLRLGVEQLRPYHALILVRSQAGLRNLYRMVTAAHLEHFHRTPRLPRRLLQANREGLLVGSACQAGEVFQGLLRGATEEELAERAAFYDFLEIQPVANNRFLVEEGALPGEEALRELNRRVCDLGKRVGRPAVATGDVHFLDPHDEIYREILKSGDKGYMDEHPGAMYLRSTDEMLEEFAYLGPELCREVVVQNPRAVAALVEDVRPVPEGLFAPVLPGAEEEISLMSHRRARELYGDPLPGLVAKRLERELKAIIGHGYAVVYLIAHKLVKKSLDDGYLVGSRGSVGSSLVATLCGITEVNPLPPHYRCPACHFTRFITDGSVGSGFDLADQECPQCGKKLHKDGHDIPFETFMGFEGDKVPDIDLNFSGQYQSHVHRYTEELFGEDYVYRAGTIATVADKTAYGLVRGYLEKLGKASRKAELNRLAAGITGVKRTTGQHPGGLMVVPQGREVIEFSPVQFPADDRRAGTRTTHFDYHSIEGRLLKLDILGHDDPTVLRLLQDLTGVDVRNVPLDDPATQSLFYGLNALKLRPSDIGGTEVGTIGVPEFGTSFVRRMLVETRPRTLSDLIRISGLSHGTDVWTNNAQELIKNETATLSQVIPCRDDIMVYLMYRGLEPGVAFKIMERVRKGKGLGVEDEQEMRRHEVPGWYIESCKKIKYMFPKAHAAAYVMMGFRIAWFKVHHPLAFYASYFTVRADAFDAHLVSRGPQVIQRRLEELEKRGNDVTAKERDLYTVLEVVREMFARGFGFHRVDLYRSHPTDFLIEEGALRPPFKSLQGLGETAAQNLAEARREAPFSSVEDLRVRARLPRTVVELLSEHGALQGLPDTNQLVLF